jgi:hypothetical protein
MTTDAERAALEDALRHWRDDRQRSDVKRDMLVRYALAAGIAKQRIYELTGIARTTINRIAAGQPCDEDAPT